MGARMFTGWDFRRKFVVKSFEEPSLIDDAFADVAAVDANGNTARDVADPSCSSIIEKASKPEALTARLCRAADKGLLPAARALLAAGTPPSEHDAAGWTPLHYAAATGDLEMLKVLLLGGADAGAASKDGKDQTPAAVAEEEENDKAAELLSTAALPAEERLRNACEAGDAEGVQAALAAGADVNAADSEGWTPLHFAASEGHAAIVKTLVDKGADATKANEDGETAAQLAEELGDEAIVQAVMEALGV